MAVTIYTTPFCPYCLAAKDLLKRKGVAFDEIGVQGNPDLRTQMREKAGGRSTVPQIFLGARHIGGCDELYGLDAAGDLDALLQEGA